MFDSAREATQTREAVMRMLVLESHPGESADFIAAAENADHQVLRCQPVDGEVVPCLGIVGDAGCPFDGRVDVAVDIHPSGASITPRELGLLCAEASEVPIVVAGTSPIGQAATEVAADDALAIVERTVRDNDARVPAYAVARRVANELRALGHDKTGVWVGYSDHDGVFDVLVDLAEPADVVDQAALDAAVLPLFVQAMREHRFGDVVYTSPGVVAES
jgi:hypothetical protein